MKLIRLMLIVVFSGTTLASADLPNSLPGRCLLGDAAQAVGIPLSTFSFKADLSDADIKKRELAMREVELAIREVEPLFNLNPDSLAEFVALGGTESKGSPISAIELQEAIIDYESLTVGKTIPKLIAFYIAKSKVGGLRPQQRAACYVMIKTAMRDMRATKKEK